MSAIRVFTVTADGVHYRYRRVVIVLCGMVHVCQIRPSHILACCEVGKFTTSTLLTKPDFDYQLDVLREDGTRFSYTSEGAHHIVIDAKRGILFDSVLKYRWNAPEHPPAPATPVSIDDVHWDKQFLYVLTDAYRLKFELPSMILMTTLELG